MTSYHVLCIVGNAAVLSKLTYTARHRPFTPTDEVDMAWPMAKRRPSNEPEPATTLNSAADFINQGPQKGAAPANYGI